MADTKMTPAGEFCWIELQTTDPASARKFYGELFSWKWSDMPGDMPYAMATVPGDKMAAGLMKQPDEAKAMGAPPCWVSYIAVDDVKATAEKAAKLGGKVLMPASPMGPGTFAVIQDPTGAPFALWHSPQSMGTFGRGEPNTLGWNELATTNVDVARSFYTQLFGWKAEMQPAGGMPYTIFKNGDTMVGGMMAMQKGMEGVPSNWAVYFSVDDCDATFGKAGKTGAKAIVPPMDIPTVGRFAVMQDAQGAAFAFIKFLPPAN